jgi:hypothetical protein
MSGRGRGWRGIGSHGTEMRDLFLSRTGTDLERVVTIAVPDELPQVSPRETEPTVLCDLGHVLPFVNDRSRMRNMTR